MKPSYRKEKDNDYMILEAPGKPEGGEYQIRMLLVNPIYGLLPCKMRMVDGSRAFYYDITEKQPMTSVFERRLMGKEDIEKLLGGLEKAMDEAGALSSGYGTVYLKAGIYFSGYGDRRILFLLSAFL